MLVVALTRLPPPIAAESADESAVKVKPDQSTESTVYPAALLRVAASIPPSEVAPVIFTVSPGSNPCPVSLNLTLAEFLVTVIGSFLRSLVGNGAL